MYWSTGKEGNGDGYDGATLLSDAIKELDKAMDSSGESAATDSTSEA